MAVQRAGDHAKAGGEGAHAEGVYAVGADDRQSLGDDPLASQGTAAGLIVVRGGEPQRRLARAGGCLRWVVHVRLQR